MESFSAAANEVATSIVPPWVQTVVIIGGAVYFAWPKVKEFFVSTIGGIIRDIREASK